MSAESSVPSVTFSSAVAAPVDDPFALLTKAVGELNQRRVAPKAAVTKSMMRRLSTELGMDTFDEHMHGYTSFRAFLKAAVERGTIILDTKSDEDYLIFLPGSMTTPDAAQQRLGPEPDQDGAVIQTQRRVRKDLWEAFIDWRKGLERVYDEQVGRAYMFPIQAVPDEPAEIAEIRQRRSAEPHRYREIIPISFDDQIEWMHAFGQSLDRPEVSEILKAGFRSDRPAAVFRSAIRAFPDIDESWRAYLLSRVIESIERWAEQEQLDVNLFEAPPRQQPRIIQAQVKPLVLNADADVAELRVRLHRAIDTMPAHELMLIRLPVGYMYLG